MIECKIIKGVENQYIQDAYYVRDMVFTKEQGFPAEIDIDDYDPIATHFILYRKNSAIGTARLIEQGNIGKIGRVAILKEYRGQHLGLKIIKEIMIKARNDGLKNLVLSAQIHAIPFYERLGFVSTGDEYLEDGEPHIYMTKSAN